MARLMAVANGNNTDAATWAVIDSTSYLESESATQAIGTSYLTTWTQFTPGAIEIDGIAMRVSVRTSTSGTFSIELYNHTAGASVAGTEVTVNTSDFVDGVSASLDGGWMFFKFTPVTLIAANAYSVRMKCSVNSAISFYGSSSTNPSRILRTTTTQAPVAGDDRFIMGEWTAAATMTSINVVPNDIVSVDYGSASTSQVTPALSISNGGSYNLSSPSAATTYVQRISGNVVIYNGGQMRIGTSGSRMPTDSSFTWTFDCANNIDFGIDVRRKGEFTAYGEQKTRWTLLTGDEAAAQTVIGVVDTTGWKVGDTLVFAATGTTANQGETKVIQTVDSGVQVTLTAGLTNAHTGTGDVVGEVGNLTSNVKIVGTSQTLCTFVCFKESSLGVLDNIEVQYLGSASASKRGVESQHINTSVNSCTFESCVFKDYFNTSAATVGNVQAAASLYYITNCVMTNNNNTSPTLCSVAGGSTGTPTFDISSNLLTGQSSSPGIGMTITLITGVGGTCTNNRIAGCTTGVSFATTFIQDTVSSISGFKIHSCNSQGMTLGTVQNVTLSNCDFVCNGTGITSHAGIKTIESCNFFGNTSGGTSLLSNTQLADSVTYNNCVFRGRTSFSQSSGVNLATQYSAIRNAVFNNCTFGVTTPHTTADINAATMMGGNYIFNSCTFASATEISSNVTTFLTDNASVQMQRKDYTDGNHVTYVKQGIITPDTTIFRTASPSLRITPKSATIPCSNKLFSFKAFVNNGEVCTPIVYVRESVVGDGTDYNGNPVKLYVKANYNLGLTTDTLLDTATAASIGAWEALTGACPAATDDGMWEFYVVEDGTTGWINADDFEYSNA